MGAISQAVLTSVISAGVVSAIVTGGVSLWNAHNDVEQKNTAMILQAADLKLKDDPAGAAVYAALMVDGHLIPASVGCNVVGLALFTGKSTPAVFTSVFAALPTALIDQNFSQPPCNIKAFAEVPQPTPAPPVDTPLQQVVCPTGTLYTQFGGEDQRDFGKKIQVALNASNPQGNVTAPQIIDKFDAKAPVIRYFFDSQADNAKRWQGLLQAALGGTPVGSAFVPGFQAAIGTDKQATFELWWPASMKPVNVKNTPCSAAVTS